MVERTLREIGSDPSILLVDDDEPFLRRLARAMEKRGAGEKTQAETAAAAPAARSAAAAVAAAEAVAAAAG